MKTKPFPQVGVRQRSTRQVREEAEFNRAQKRLRRPEGEAGLENLFGSGVIAHGVLWTTHVAASG